MFRVAVASRVVAELDPPAAVIATRREDRLLWLGLVVVFAGVGGSGRKRRSFPAPHVIGLDRSTPACSAGFAVRPHDVDPQRVAIGSCACLWHRTTERAFCNRRFARGCSRRRAGTHQSWSRSRRPTWSHYYRGGNRARPGRRSLDWQPAAAPSAYSELKTSRRCRRFTAVLTNGDGLRVAHRVERPGARFSAGGRIGGTAVHRVRAHHADQGWIVYCSARPRNRQSVVFTSALTGRNAKLARSRLIGSVLIECILSLFVVLAAAKLASLSPGDTRASPQVTSSRHGEKRRRSCSRRRAWEAVIDGLWPISLFRSSGRYVNHDAQHGRDDDGHGAGVAARHRCPGSRGCRAGEILVWPPVRTWTNLGATTIGQMQGFQNGAAFRGSSDRAMPILASIHGRDLRFVHEQRGSAIMETAMFRVVLGLLLLWLPLQPRFAAAQGFSPQQREEIVRIVREALRQDPASCARRWRPPRPTRGTGDRNSRAKRLPHIRRH